MSLVVSNVNLENVYSDFESLLNNLQDLLVESGYKTRISSTKFGIYKKMIQDRNQIDARDFSNLIAIVNRYNELNILFKKSNNIIFDNRELMKIIEGKALVDDSKEEFNNIFFELSMAIRFSKAFDNDFFKIDLTSICDLIINDSVAIECKYIHGKNRLEENIKKAIQQINARVENGLAKFGIIALDISNLIDKEKVRKFSEEIFQEFVISIEKLEKNSFVSEMIKEEGIYSSVINNSNFGNIIQSFSAHCLEQKFYESLHKNLKIRINSEKHIVAVIFQSYDNLCFEYNGIRYPLPARALTYFINETLDERKSKLIEKIIHSLAVGV